MGRNEKGKKQNTSKKLFFNFFGISFWIGLILILIACSINFLSPIFPEVESGTLEAYKKLINFLVNVSIAGLQTAGVACMLGAIFDFSKNSQAFIEFVSTILSDIIVGKTFLSKMEDTGKREALNLILRPSENQITQYSRIDDYFNKKINDSMKMWDTNFKTNLVLTIEVRREKDTGRICSFGKLTYRVYKVKDKYDDIITMFERKNSHVSNTRLIYPGGKLDISDDAAVKPETETAAGVDYQKFSFSVPEHLYQYPYLTVERDIYEPGSNHWTNFHWTSLTPYDGLVFSLRCLDDLTIKDYAIFDDKQLYNVTTSPDKTEMRILSTDWLDANTGFSITISATELEQGGA